jgi:fructose-bisphosphate aldolase class II
MHRDAALDHQLIAALRATVAVPLVLHGSSGVPDDELRGAVAGGPKLIDPRKYLAPARHRPTRPVDLHRLR